MFQHKIVRQERKRERHIGKSKPNKLFNRIMSVTLTFNSTQNMISERMRTLMFFCNKIL